MEQKTLQTQLLEFQKKVSVIKKDAKNPHFKNTYATLTQILSEVKPLLTDLGLVLTQPIIDDKVYTAISLNGKDEQNYVHSCISLPTNLNPQQLGSAITYFRRYTLASLLALEIDDDDANEATKQPQKPLSVEATQAMPLTDKAFLAMLESLKKGDIDKVKAALPKYTLLKAQKDELDKYLNK
jgi:hypothetical protein